MSPVSPAPLWLGISSCRYLKDPDTPRPRGCGSDGAVLRCAHPAVTSPPFRMANQTPHNGRNGTFCVARPRFVVRDCRPFPRAIARSLQPAET